MACPSGQVCSVGACSTTCGGGLSRCGDEAGAPYCANLQTDNANCGTCGTPCPAGQVCSGGACATTCGSPLTECNGGDAGAPYCANLQTDDANCGACGTACAPGQTCSNGACTLTCAAPQTQCNGADAGAPYCANLQTDNANCGSCGTPCPAGQVCSGGKCAATCGAPFVQCGQSCADTDSDPDNCGGCGTVCGPYAHATAACVSGKCQEICDAQYLDCSGTGTAGCNVDSQTDPDNCNGCGTVCGPYPNATAQCASGACGYTCDGSWLDCDGHPYNGCEIDSAVDVRNCGACGNSCLAGCTGGVCRKVTAVGAGRYHTCAVLEDGSVWCWGMNDLGQAVGDNKVVNPKNPALVAGVTGATQVGGGRWYSCALVTNGAVECWGGLPGTGPPFPIQAPTLVPGLSGAVSIATGLQHACALLGDGSVDCWGLNDHGQLGDGSTTSRASPAPVPGLSGVRAVAAGGAHTCAIMADNSVDCWGDDTHGQLGNGTTAGVVATPQPVTSGPAFDRLACGAAHTCAMSAYGGAFCWGANDVGQLGDGTTTDRLLPTQVGPMGSVGAFDEQTCAGGGTTPLYCWGGLFGAGSYVDTPTLAGVYTANAIAVGGAHDCAILPDGSLECWGANQYGQLGDGTLIGRLNPAPVVWQ